mmetsp:Transcript_901/g.2028  ORF Transcript_901/g.2028 Transcript_901/m.2028 type:complete len:656 (+) Transcript_901:86-2053(+)
MAKLSVSLISAALSGLLTLESSVAEATSGGQEAYVLKNGTIYTMSPDLPYASALCVQDGKIEAIGSETEVMLSACASRAAASTSGTRVVDLEGATVTPGLTDSHAHLMMEAARRLRADLIGSADASDAAERALSWAKSRPDLVQAAGGWVQGFGWDQTVWKSQSFPTHEDLDRLFPDTPVYMEQLSGHACWINKKALDIIANEIPATGDPPGGHIERDSSGKPTGILSDGAMVFVQKHITPYTVKHSNDALTLVLKDCAANGLTGVHDMDSFPPDIKLFQTRHAEGSLSLRLYVAIDGARGGLPSDPKIFTKDGLLTKKAVKFFSDGAMGSWSAAMLKPYNDRPNVSGTLVWKTEEFKEKVASWAAAGYQVATHAIGDAANRQVLDVYESIGKTFEGGTSDRRWRVEHAQILSAEDLGRFAKLGVIPSMQPSHEAADLSYAEARLGHDRASRSYAWSTLLKTGIKALPFGSDFPTAGSIPPLLGFHAAVTRETPQGIPAGGWFPNERVTREQAIKGYTVDAAYASFREADLGRLLPGFYADLVVFDRDLLTCDSKDILNASVLATVVGGDVVHAANASSSSAAKAIAKLVRPGAPNFHHMENSDGPTSSPRRAALELGSKLSGDEASNQEVYPKFWWRTYAEDAREDHIYQVVYA